MKVTNHNLTGLGATGADRAQDTSRTSGGATGAGAGGGDGDRVDLSSMLGSLSRALSSFGSSRGAMVAGLAAQYQAGNYAADSGAIGRGLISEAMSE